MTHENRRQDLYELLGKLPSRDRKITVKKVGEQEHEAYFLEKLVLDLNGVEPVPAYFLRSKSAEGRRPVIVYNHAHGGDYVLGKDEIVSGQSALQKPAYGEQLVSMGISVLCIDFWCFGERRGRTESEIFKEMLWKGQVLWGMMVYDSIRAVDYLMTRSDVDPSRIGTLGLSMGSTMAWWLSALDTRVKVTVDLCCLTDYEALLATRGLDWHSFYYYVPNLLNHFTTSQINGLIAPRPHLSLAGIYDPLTPLEGLDRIDGNLTQLYSSLCAPEAWKLVKYNTGHFETADMRDEVLTFLRKWL